MKTRISGLLAIFPILICACVAVPQKPAAVESHPVQTDGKPAATVRKIVRERIDFLELVLESRNTSPKQKRIAERLLASYRTIESYSDNSTLPDSGKIGPVLLNSLELLEREYFLSHPKEAQEPSSSLELLEKKEHRILELYASKDFDAVIEQCLQFRSLFGRQALTPRIGLVFALSLGEKGRLREALRVGEGIAGYLEKKPDLIELQLAISRWNLKLGRDAAARQTYADMSTRLKRHNTRAEVLSAEISPITTPVPDREITRTLERVDRLILEKSFARARDLLEAASSRAQQESSIRAIEAAYHALESAENEYLENKIAAIARKKEGLQSARKLLEQEKFEQAIKEIELLEADQAATAELMQLKRLAIERLINRERNRAAKLFLLAKKTRNHAEKINYLQSSLKVLKSIYNKYPASGLNHKVKSHIEQVSEELAEIE
jgi:hypothetical protein